MLNRTKYYCLPGMGLSDLLDKFISSFRDNPFDTFFIVPTARLKNEIMRRLQEKNIPILENRICTLGDLAGFIFSEDNHGLYLMNDEESKLIISEIISQHPDRFNLFTHKGRISVGNVRQLRQFVSTLIQWSVDYPACLGELQSEKSNQIANIHSNYLHFLERNRLIDDDLLLLSAINSVKTNEKTKSRRIYVYGLFEPNPLEKKFLKALSESSSAFYYALPFGENPLIFIDSADWLPIIEKELIKSNEKDIALSKLFYTTEKNDLSKNMFLTSFKDRISEVRAIAQKIRDLIRDGADAGRVAVVFPDRVRGARLVSDVFPDFGIPYDIRNYEELSQSPIVQTIFHIIGVPASGYRRESVIDLLKSSYIRFFWGEDDNRKRLWGQEVDFESREANIIEGIDNWRKSFSMIIAELNQELQSAEPPEHRISDLKHRIERIEEIKDGIDELFKDLEKLEGNKTINEHITELRSLLSKWEFTHGTTSPDQEIYRRDARALSSFFKVLDSTEKGYLMIPERRMDLADFFTTLSILISEKGFNAKDGNSNAVQITGLREVGHSSFDYVFIPDIVDGELPRTDLLQPFATDLEVKRMKLLRKADLLRQERYYFLAALSTAKKGSYLSYPLSEDDQPIVPSCFVKDISESYSTGSWEIRDTPSSRLLQQFDEGKRISSIDFKSIRLVGIPPLNPEMIASRINIENYYRKRDYSSEFDCILTDDSEIIKGIAEGFNDSKVYSPTMFESYGLCPFQFYLKYVIYLNVLPEIETELSPSEKGTLFHRIAFRFYTERKRNGRSKITADELPASLQDIKKIAMEEFQDFSFQDPVWSAFKDHYLGVSGGRKGLLECFLENEAEYASSEFFPAYFEFSIGSNRDPDLSDGHSISDPISIDLGSGDPSCTLIRGKIDRIDIAGRNQFMILDYKTGKRNASTADIRSGLSFQLPLYIRCIEASFPGWYGVGGAYYNVNSQEIAKKVVLGDKANRDLFGSLSGSRGISDDYQAIISSSLESAKLHILNMRKGIYHPVPQSADCRKYCDYKTICRFHKLRLLECGRTI